jgi:excisionase family DNA binding protein
MIMESWLTVKKAAPMTGMSEQALYTAIREKKFPAIRIGRRIRISPQSLAEWAKRGGSVKEEETNDAQR